MDSTSPAFARAQRLLAQVMEGKTVFFKAGNGWDIIGPATDIQPGHPVVVTKADGDTVEVIPIEIMSERTVDGTTARTARFRRTTTPGESAAQPRPVYPVIDRTAATIGDMLGRTSSAFPGFCHFCGLELNRAGRCEECI